MISVLISPWLILTLKQTKREKGRVTITSSHEMAVNSHPHIPIPTSSDSPAEKERKLHTIRNVLKHKLTKLKVSCKRFLQHLLFSWR